MKTVSFFVAILLVTLPLSLIAQGSSTREIEKAAALYARSHYSSGRVVFDPRSAYLKGTNPSRTPQEINSLAQQLGATSVADQSKYLVCSGAPKVCRIRGADRIISINRPEVAGDTAYVIVRVLEPTTFASHPINRREDRLLIVDAGGSWKFVKLVGGGSIN
jgi:hypothetical protein